MAIRPDRATEPTIAQKLAFLSALPGVSQVIETHMSYVFLTAISAFKLKKPVSFGYFDHRTRLARASACSEEMRLNQPLARQVYLEMIPLTQAGDQLALAGAGRVVDWLVHMRRLPADRMLDVVIAQKRGPSGAEVSALAALLADFYRAQQATRPPAGLYYRHLQREQACNAANLTQMSRFLPDVPLPAILSTLKDRLDRAEPEITARETAGLVLEGHGDLRPEHVCLTEPPVIFDRVETALEMRIVDIHDEVRYLTAECAMLGRPDVRGTLMAALEAAGFAPPTPQTLTTYAMFRLVTRARLSLDHLRDSDPRTPDKWPVRARDYLTEVIRLSDGAMGQTGI